MKDFLENHATKIIGYITIAAGFLATADPALVGELLGDKWQKWALLIAGMLTAMRGHQNTARINKEST
jgi:hypothetical protein